MSKIIISRELAEAITGHRAKEINITHNTITITVEHYGDEEINLYEFIHKNCKEWAHKKGYILLSANYVKSGICFIIKDFPTATIEDAERFEKWNTENESIIKSCEWIMEQAK